MKDYSDIGLDNQLRAINAISSGTSGFTDAYSWDALTDVSLVGERKVSSLSFNKIQGGTCILGGTANGNGIFTLNNASGSAIVQMNNAGLVVNSGSITIQNSSGTTILDSYGLNSINNFGNDYIVFSGTATTTSSTPTPVANGTLDPIVLSRDTNIYIYLVTVGYNEGLVGTAYPLMAVGLYEGTTALMRTYPSGKPVYNIDGSGHVTEYALIADVQTNAGIGQFAAGTHTFATKFYIIDGGTADLFGFEVGYIVLGA